MVRTILKYIFLSCGLNTISKGLNLEEKKTIGIEKGSTPYILILWCHSTLSVHSAPPLACFPSGLSPDRWTRTVL